MLMLFHVCQKSQCFIEVGLNDSQDMPNIIYGWKMIDITQNLEEL